MTKPKSTSKTATTKVSEPADEIVTTPEPEALEEAATIAELEAVSDTETVTSADAETPEETAEKVVPGPIQDIESEALVMLLKGQQITDPGTKVILRKDQWVPVPKISRWVQKQQGYGLLKYRKV